MTAIGRIEAPLVNPNEPEAQVTALFLEAFGPIARGQVLATLETSKASLDLESEWDGFVGPVGIAVGDRVAAGALICEVFDARPDPAAVAAEPAPAAGARKVTRKAAALAAEHGVDLAQFTGTGFVTEADVQAVLGTGPGPLPNFSERSLVLYGGGGLARVIVDLVAATGEYEIAGVVDDGGSAGLDGVPLLGGGGVLGALAEAGLRHAVNAVGAIGRMSVRRDVSARLAAAGLAAPVLVDPSASVAATAVLEPGALVFAQAVVSAAARVGAGSIVNSAAVVSHDCVVGADAHIAPGAILAGEVVVGDGALVGMAVTVPVGVSIGAGAVVGNGATVLADVPPGAVVGAGAAFTGRP